MPTTIRRSHLSRSEVLSRLNISEDQRPLVLVAVGGWEAAEIGRVTIKGCRDYRFLVVGDLPVSAPETTLLNVPFSLTAGVHFQDLVAAADAGIVKPGYGTCAEFIVNAGRMVGITRNDNREAPVLAAAVVPAAAAEDAYVGVSVQEVGVNGDDRDLICRRHVDVERADVFAAPHRIRQHFSERRRVADAAAAANEAAKDAGEAIGSAAKEAGKVVDEAARDAGIRHFEAGGGARYQALYFYSNEDAFDMMDTFREKAGWVGSARLGWRLALGRPNLGQRSNRRVGGRGFRENTGLAE